MSERTSPGRYRKKPVEIEAMLLTWESVPEVEAWIGAGCKGHYDPTGKLDGFAIATLEGVMLANLGDWIIRGVKGEFYPCKPDIFKASYEVVELMTAEEREQAEIVFAIDNDGDQG